MIDLSFLGTVRADGSVLLSNDNINYRQEMTGDYERIRQSSDVNYELSLLGYQAVTSSVISAIGVFGDNLQIRFHNGSVYEYYGFADRFAPMMRALSKGQYFNRNIRPTKNYAKLGNIDFTSGNASQETDRQLFDKAETQTVAGIVKTLQGRVLHAVEVKIKGIEYIKYQIDDLIFYRPLISLKN